MKIQVRLYADLKSYGPDGRHDFDLDLLSNSSMQVKDIPKLLDIRSSILINILVNGKYASRDRVLKKNDRLDVFPLMDGG